MRPWAIVLCLAAMSPPAAGASEPECVVLLHGIGMSAVTMKPLEAALRRQGYRTVNVGYPSRRRPLEELAGGFLGAKLAEADVARAPRLHFVTHSMGGIMLRMHLLGRRPANLGRVVMIAPPNQGSAAADAAAKNAFLRSWFGPNLPRLGTGDESIARRLGPADFEAGVIAGTASLNPLFRRRLARPHDGAVSVEATRLDGMRDFITLPHSHTAMLWRGATARQVIAFLRDGRFARGAPAPDAAPR